MKTTKTPGHMTKRVAYILDKSGSMGTCRQQVVDGTNDYFDALCEQDPETRVTITMFDTNVIPICNDVPVSEIPPLTFESYVPNGCTALYDAVASAIIAMESDPSPFQERLCVIFTDGQENSSRTISRRQLARMIQEREATGRWTFIYLGADQDSWANAEAMGIARGRAVNYDKSNSRVDMRRVGRMNADLLEMKAASAPMQVDALFQGAQDIADVTDDPEVLRLSWMPKGKSK